jgi:hypothetical protein
MRFMTVLFFAIAAGVPAMAQDAAGAGVSFGQNGAAVARQPVYQNEWLTVSAVTLAAGPMAIALPMAGCDAASEVTMVRVLPEDRYIAVLGDLVTVEGDFERPEVMKQVFKDDYGMAADAPQTVLYMDDPTQPTMFQGFNYLYAPRYAATTADSVTINVDSIDRLGLGPDPLASGQPFLLLMGRLGCGSDLKIDLVSVQFSAG